jgi:glycosyltransferase involved in cell wall biosynthesis
MATSEVKQGSQPWIDVIIPCYNQGRYLAEAVESMLGQSYPHVGVIVVDDGSTDDTSAVAARYGERIRYIRKENAGRCAARNTGILEARGEFVVFLDADDYLWPDALQRLMEAAANTPEGAVFHGSSQMVDINGRPLAGVTKPPLPADVFHALLKDNYFAIHALAIRRSALANVGLFDVHLELSEDWDLWLRLAAVGCRFVAVPEAVAVYRRYPGNSSRNYEAMWQSGLAVLRKSQAYHGHCALCRRALRRGRARLRKPYFEYLIGTLYARKAQNGILASLAKAFREVIRDPGLAGLLLREVVPYLCGAHALPCPGIASARLSAPITPAEPVAAGARPGECVLQRVGEGENRVETSF